MTDAEYQDALETAESIGKDHGENAAAWWEQENVGGRVSNRADAEHAARTTIDACEDGDPCLYDAIPAPDLSGQGADGYSSQDLMASVCKALGISLATTFTSRSGRPMKIANGGKVIKGLFA